MRGERGREGGREREGDGERKSEASTVLADEAERHGICVVLRLFLGVPLGGSLGGPRLRAGIFPGLEFDWVGSS